MKSGQKGHPGGYTGTVFFFFLFTSKTSTLLLRKRIFMKNYIRLGRAGAPEKGGCHVTRRRNAIRDDGCFPDGVITQSVIETTKNTHLAPEGRTIGGRIVSNWVHEAGTAGRARCAASHRRSGGRAVQTHRTTLPNRLGAAVQDLVDLVQQVGLTFWLRFRATRQAGPIRHGRCWFRLPLQLGLFHLSFHQLRLDQGRHLAFVLGQQVGILLDLQLDHLFDELAQLAVGSVVCLEALKPFSPLGVEQAVSFEPGNQLSLLHVQCPAVSQTQPQHELRNPRPLSGSKSKTTVSGSTTSSSISPPLLPVSSSRSHNPISSNWISAPGCRGSSRKNPPFPPSTVPGNLNPSRLQHNRSPRNGTNPHPCYNKVARTIQRMLHS